MADDKEPWHLRVVVFIITHLIYFVIGFFWVPLVVFGKLRGSAGYGSPLYLGASFILLGLVGGVISAIIGPSIYDRESKRGRGDLAEIRRNSQYCEPYEDVQESETREKTP